VKTNAAEPWYQITNNATPNGVLQRPDWAGVRLQVGIAHAAFNAAARDAVFDNFELSGDGVTFPVLPAAPSALVATATNTLGALTFSWNSGAAGNNSLVVISTRPIQHNPVHGIMYNANSSYGDPASLLGGAGHYVVYSGSGNSVTVTNLGANNVTYYVTVFSYSNAGDPVYNTVSPATAAFVGPGIITSASVVAPANSIPINGAVKLSLIASFSTGETSDQSAATTWTSGDTAVAGVNAAGVVSGLMTGSSTITATFGQFISSTNISVRESVFTDTFTSTNDYTVTGLVGTAYDGLFMNFGDVPGAVAGGDGNGSTVALDSQISNTNGLFMSSVQSTWNNTANDGPFLYKIVPGGANSVSGDFQAVLHINNMNTLNGVVAGLMARLFNSANHGPGPAGLEHHVEFWKVQDGATSVRRTQDQPGNNTTTLAAGTDVNWILLTRVNSTNFYFFEKAQTNDNWNLVTSVVLAAAANNAPMEVGIAQQSTAGVNALTTFDHFMLDAAGIVSTNAIPAPAANMTMTLNPDLSIRISYTVGTNQDGTAIRSVVVMRDGGPVTAQPYTGMGLAGNSAFGDPNNSLGGGNYVVYRSPANSQNTNPSVSVTGLTPGHTYYAAVYTFVGAGATRTFNNDASNASSSLQDGVLESLEALPTPPIPRGGIGFVQVLGHYTGGAVLNVSPFATITSDNTNVVKVLNGVLTGITNGSANVRLIYSGVTNDAVVTVREPTFTDEFEVNRNYLAGGLTGSGWDGLYSPDPTANPIPSSPYVPLALSGATVADANITTPGALTITAAGDGWENANSGGLFLFQYVPGDFQMAVQIQSFEVAAFNQPGLLARAYGVDTTGAIGAPLGVVVPNANGTNDLGEYWVSFTRFDEFGIGTYARRNLDSVVSQNTQPDPAPGDTNYWLLIVRSNGTEFDFYKRGNETEPWRQVPNRTHYSLAQFAGRPMQVGIMAGPWTGAAGTPRTVQFDRFMLDTTSGSPLSITTSGNNVMLSWGPIPGVLQSTSSLTPAQWLPVAGTPVLGSNGYTLSLPLGNGPMFFRLVQ
jgi:hypothetical protein